MLVLTRGKDATIRIGKDVVITVVRVRGKFVQLGIEAPHETKILRGELIEDQEAA